jgi:hypothetical protein
MREFTIDVSKTLPKGLSPIEDREGLIPGLHECWNFVPDEAGLKPWEPFLPTGWQGAYFNYLPIRDQTGVLWYWYPVFDGHILVDTDIPSEPSTQLVAISLVVNPVSWIDIPDENGAIWQLYPDTVDGFTRATDSTPLGGEGLQNIVWRGTTSELWTIRFDSVSHTRYAVKIRG